MTIEKLEQLQTLLDEFINDRDSAAAESIKNVTSQRLAAKMLEHIEANLQSARFTRNWIHATYCNTLGYKKELPLF